MSSPSNVQCSGKRRSYSSRLGRSPRCRRWKISATSTLAPSGSALASGPAFQVMFRRIGVILRPVLVLFRQEIAFLAPRLQRVGRSGPDLHGVGIVLGEDFVAHSTCLALATCGTTCRGFPPGPARLRSSRKTCIEHLSRTAHHSLAGIRAGAAHERCPRTVRTQVRGDRGIFLSIEQNDLPLPRRREARFDRSPRYSNGGPPCHFTHASVTRLVVTSTTAQARFQPSWATPLSVCGQWTWRIALHDRSGLEGQPARVGGCELGSCIWIQGHGSMDRQVLIKLPIDATSAAAPSWRDFKAASMTVASATGFAHQLSPGWKPLSRDSRGVRPCGSMSLVTISPVVTEEIRDGTGILSELR